MPSSALRKMSRLMIPMLIVTGRNRIRTWRTRGSRQSNSKAKRNSIRRSAKAISSELHDGRHQPRDRVGVDGVLAVEVGVQDHHQDDDHDVPDRGRERRDRELVVGLQDPDQQTGEAEQQDHREQHPGQAGGQDRLRRGERGAGEQRHDQPGHAHVDDRQRPEPEQDQPEQRSRRGETPRASCRLCSSSVKIGTNAADSAACENRLLNRFGIWEATVNADPAAEVPKKLA